MTTSNTLFASRLKEAMGHNGINATELCKRTGLTPSAISRYLSSDRMPNVDKLFTLADSLNVEPRWLAGKDRSNK